MNEYRTQPPAADAASAAPRAAVPGKSTLTGALVQRAAASPGAPLPDAARGRFESSLGADLSSVRVHTGGDSADAAGALGARAFATGNDIHFAASAYAPDEPGGLHLLAHEVAHTQQQAGGAPVAQAKLAVSAPGDASEQDADTAADAMVAGAPASVSAVASAPIQRDTTPATADKQGDPAADFRAAVDAKPFSELRITAAWKKLDDKSAVEDTVIAKAIAGLQAKTAMQIIQESGKGFTDPIVDAILANKLQHYAWHQQLKGVAEEIALCGDTEPKARLRPLAKVIDGALNPQSGYQLALSAQPQRGKTLDRNAKYVLEISDTGALAFPKAMQPKLEWKLTAPTDVFGPGPFAPVPATEHAPTVQYELVAHAPGTTQVTVDAISISTDGIAGHASQTYALDVLDSAKDPTGFFEARFEEEFADIVKPLFESKPVTPGAIAALFTKEQQTALLGYMSSRIVPRGLFTLVTQANKATGPQRILIAGHMLANGRIELDGGEMEGTKWCASCCGGWVNGVYVYAGENWASGYGTSDGDLAISPTGEKSFGTGAEKDGTVADSQKVLPGLQKVLDAEQPFKAKVSGLEAKAKAEKQAGDIAAYNKKTDDAKKDYAAEHDDEAALASAKAQLPGQLAPYKEQEKAAKLAGGSSPFGPGDTNFPTAKLASEIRTGDWLYLDNNGGSGHSVIFRDWVDDPTATPPSATEALPTAQSVDAHKDDPTWSSAVAAELEQPRTVTYLRARLFDQPDPKKGGQSDTYKLGFPQSSVLDVNGVWSIVHPQQNGQPAGVADADVTQPGAHTGEVDQFLVYTAGGAKTAAAANRATMKLLKLDAEKVHAKLAVTVQAMLDGISTHVRPDQAGAGGVSGELTPKQQVLCAAVVKGNGDTDDDIANLVALGQKLASLDAKSGNPSIDGLLTTAVETAKGKSWPAPAQAWAGDASLKAT